MGVYQVTAAASDHGGSRRRPSGIPRSRGSSREPSPSRSYGLRYNLRTPPAAQQQRPLLTEKILKQSREAENVLADALVSFEQKKSLTFEQCT